MAIILNIETATEVSSVCIAAGTKILSIKESEEKMAHTRETTLLIQACLIEAGLTMAEVEAVAVSSGPGSYTALRVGSSTAKGICYTQDIPLIGISTLHALALVSSKVQTGDIYCPMIDARRKEVYLGNYNNIITSVNPAKAQILTDAFIEELSEQGQIVFSGNGTPKLEEMVSKPNFHYTPIRCSSAHLVPLSAAAYQAKKWENMAYFEPTYLKPPNITVSKKRL